MTGQDQAPNILLLMPDQMRGDCLSLAGHPVLLTPNMDQIGGQGAFFTHAYSTCASCIPARRSLLTGQAPATHGMVGFVDGVPLTAPTLPEQLGQAGYRTALVGRTMHQYPADAAYGFETRNLGSTYRQDDSYAAMLETAVPGFGGMRGLGLSFNGWQARPWPLPDALHPTHWTVQQSREFIAADTSDERPLFLTTSFYAPHPPLCPPSFYMERYLRQALPPAAMGDWVDAPVQQGWADGVDAHHVRLEGEALRSAQAGYFGLINHIDDQLTWLIPEFQARSRAMGRPWVIVLTSDHGEMLGDHALFRKCEPYEGASRIPFLIWAAPELGFKPGLVCEQPVSLEDVMPTLLELAGVSIPDGVDGRSLVPVLRGEAREILPWSHGPWLHGEHAPCYGPEQAYHFLTDGREKYIWRPLDGAEQLFDLRADPQELHNLAGDPPGVWRIARWRARLIEILAERPEGFTDGERLIPGRSYPPVLPHAPRP